LQAMHYRGLLRIARRDDGIRIYALHQQPGDAIDAKTRDLRLDALVDLAAQTYAPLPAPTLSWLVSRLRWGTPQWAAKNDPRITRVGNIIRKLRIDELPQILNVLKGQMSFVGPRPERPYFVEQLTERVPYYNVRHSIKPGITGWAQVRYGYGDSVEDAVQKLQYDLYYVKNNSLLLDVLVLIDTFKVVVFRGGR